MAGLYNYIGNGNDSAQKSAAQREQDSQKRSSLTQWLSLLISSNEKAEARANSFYNQEDKDASSRGLLEAYSTYSPTLQSVLKTTQDQEMADSASIIGNNGRLSRKQAAVLHQRSLTRQAALAKATSSVNSYIQDKQYRDQLKGNAQGGLPIFAMDDVTVEDYMRGDVPKARLAVSGTSIIAQAKEAVKSVIDSLPTNDKFTTRDGGIFIEQLSNPACDQAALIQAFSNSEDPNRRNIATEYQKLVSYKMAALRQAIGYDNYCQNGQKSIDDCIYLGGTNAFEGFNKTTYHNNPDHITPLQQKEYNRSVYNDKVSRAFNILGLTIKEGGENPISEDTQKAAAAIAGTSIGNPPKGGTVTKTPASNNTTNSAAGSPYSTPQGYANAEETRDRPSWNEGKKTKVTRLMKLQDPDDKSKTIYSSWDVRNMRSILADGSINNNYLRSGSLFITNGIYRPDPAYATDTHRQLDGREIYKMK